MDTIYSRTRIRIPKFNFGRPKIPRSHNKKISKLFKAGVILLVAVITFTVIIKAVNPIFESLCIKKAIYTATEVMDTETNNILSQYDYSNLLSNIGNSSDNTKILQTNVQTLNKITVNLTLAMNERFQELKNEKVGIPLGALTGNEYLAGFGPKIEITVVPAGNVDSEVKTEFASGGINQTIYRIYLYVKGTVDILMPYNTIAREVENKVLLVETVIVGNVPQTYLDLDKAIQGINSGGKQQ